MKAIALFSGGLDSLLAIKLIQSQGTEVIAVAFRSPFYIASEEKKKKLEKVAKKNKFKIKFIEFGKDYLKLIRKPKYGYGKNLNPCIDCHAFMLKKAKKYANKINASFIFTGEVLNERPLSQNRQSLDIVEKESGLKGKLLRPLSAKLLPKTEAEKKKIVNRNKLLDISGRSRKRQFKLARKFGIKEFETPAGGCLLTNKEYSNKLRDLFNNNKKIDLDDIKLLRVGRHFRVRKNKIIVGRNEKENKALLKSKQKSDIILEVKDYVGPITILKGKLTKKAIQLAASLTARYSDAKRHKVIVRYYKGKIKREVVVNKLKDREIGKLRI